MNGRHEGLISEFGQSPMVAAAYWDSCALGFMIFRFWRIMNQQGKILIWVK